MDILSKFEQISQITQSQTYRSNIENWINVPQIYTKWIIVIKMYKSFSHHKIIVPYRYTSAGIAKNVRDDWKLMESEIATGIIVIDLCK